MASPTQLPPRHGGFHGRGNRGSTQTENSVSQVSDEGGKKVDIFGLNHEDSIIMICIILHAHSLKNSYYELLLWNPAQNCVRIYGWILSYTHPQTTSISQPILHDFFHGKFYPYFSHLSVNRGITYSLFSP